MTLNLSLPPNYGNQLRASDVVNFLTQLLASHNSALAAIAQAQSDIVTAQGTASSAQTTVAAVQATQASQATNITNLTTTVNTIAAKVGVSAVP
jgi:hypothetical protein